MREFPIEYEINEFFDDYNTCGLEVETPFENTDCIIDYVEI